MRPPAYGIQVQNAEAVERQPRERAIARPLGVCCQRLTARDGVVEELAVRQFRHGARDDLEPGGHDDPAHRSEVARFRRGVDGGQRHAQQRDRALGILRGRTLGQPGEKRDVAR